MSYETPNEEIIEGLREGLRDTLDGYAHPFSELWSDLEYAPK